MNAARSSLKKGFLWLGSAAAVARLVDVVAMLVAIRRLTNAEVGAASIAWTLAVVLEAWNGGGTGTAVLNVRRLPRRTLDTAFWLASGIGLLLTLLAVLVAPVVAAIYADPSIAPLVAVSGIKLVAVSVASVPTQRLGRALRFEAIAATQVLATLLAAIVRVGLAYGGAGAWALVGAHTAHGVAQLVAILAVAPYRPRWVFDRAAARELLQFGAHTAGADTVYQLHRNVDKLLVGRFLGLDVLGVYRIVFDVAMEPVIAITDVVSRTAARVLCRLPPEGGEIVRTFLWTVRQLSIALLPLLFALALGFEPVLSLFGKGRFEGVTLVSRLLLVAAYGRAIAQLVPTLLIATGRPAAALRISLLTLAFLVASLVVGLAIGGTNAGLLPVALAWVAAVAVEIVLGLRSARERTTLEMPAFARAFVAPLKCAAVLAAASPVIFVVSRMLPSATLRIAFILGSVGLVFALFVRLALGTRPVTLLGDAGTTPAAEDDP